MTSIGSSLVSVSEKYRTTRKLLIDGKWVDASNGETIATFSPSTGELLANVAAAQKREVDLAVAAAQRAFDAGPWSRMGPHERSRVLRKIGEAVETHAEELAQLDVADAGIPISMARWMVSAAAEQFFYFSGWASKIYGETVPGTPDMFMYTLREPLGVCGQIIPWNAPLIMASWKIAPALACGNTVVLKPAELAPLSALRLAELILETGLPDGVLNVVTGDGVNAGAALAGHPVVRKIAFTGSTVTGKNILAASTGNLKRTTLELGGKSPHILFADGNIDAAIPQIITGFTACSGQLCGAGTRVFVQRDIYDQVAERLCALTGVVVGDPLDEQTTVGPLISKGQFERVTNYLEIGRSEGATASVGGKAHALGGNYVEPTLFTNVSNSMRIAREEIFGPVAAMIPFENEDEVIRLSNDSEYGLAAGLWTADGARAQRVARRLQAGTVWINTYMNGDPIIPFGGYKQSGTGRENGRDAIDMYTQIKSIFMQI